MRILALETSTRRTSIAVLDDANILCQSTAQNEKMGYGNGTSSRLIPEINSLLDQINCKIGQIQVIAVAIGPGSFTGLRIGIVTAKTLAYAMQARIIGINTLNVIAEQSLTFAQSSQPNSSNSVHAVINAQRSELFAAEFRHENGKIEMISPPRIVGRSNWLENLSQGDLVSGPGLKPMLAEIRKSPGLLMAPEDSWFPSAATLGQLAAARVARGEYDDLWTLKPLYLRPSYAEEH